MVKFFGNKYVSKYQDYFKLPWYESDLMTYYDHLNYQDMAKNSDDYFKNKKLLISI